MWVPVPDFRRIVRRLVWGLSLWTTVTAVRAVDPTPYPRTDSRKGLQVQMLDDALALGIRHAALNFNLAQALDVSGAPAGLHHDFGGRRWSFHRGYLEAMDAQVRELSSHGVVVSLILLNYEASDPGLRKLLLHPKYDPACPNHLSAFNTVTEEGRAAFAASMDFLAARWSGGDAETHGRIWNWIVGNEVNSHWFWSNRGLTTPSEFCADYERTVRIVHEAVRRHSAEARVFLSLEHHWNIPYPGGREGQVFPGRPFLEEFARRAREGGDFDWHLAFHPYPENLFEPRTWKDASAKPDWRTTPRITFRNLAALGDFLDQDALKFRGVRRRVILSEQGFHTPDGPDGEDVQAAGYCYAWKQVERLPWIDSFILHRHVDHGAEGGLRLGLWTRKPDSVATPDRKKRLYEIFRKAGTPEGDEAFRFALPIVGIPDWSALGTP